MKIINSVVVLMILVCGSQLSRGEKLNCGFGDVIFHLDGSFYSCEVKSLDNRHNNLTIEGYSGEHWANNNDSNVKGIWIHDTNTKNIPMNLGCFSNLIVLDMVGTQLVEIKAKYFHGMQDLEYLRLSFNKLSSVPLDVFTTLTKLRFINLSSNQIEELPNGIFANNLELEGIYLSDNKINYLGTELFHDLNKLDVVELRGNICVSKYYNGATEINQLKDDIKMKCKNPNEVQATTTTTTQTPTTTSTTQTPTTQTPTTQTPTTQTPTTTPTTQTSSTTSTTQNPMDVKLIEIQEQIWKLEKETKELQQKNEAKATKASNGEKLNCEFRNVEYDGGFDIVGSLYSCVVTSLVNTHNNLTIDGYSGVHMTNKNDADVKAIRIHDTNTKYIPTNPGYFSNLTALHLRNIQLVEIKAKDFHGIQNLEFLSFVHNKLSSVPLNAFATLTKLIIIDLSSNQIEELPNGIFVNCLELKEIYLNHNKIKYLGTEIFNSLKKLNWVDLESNICINEYYIGAIKIIQLKEDIKMKCKNSNEVPATTPTTTPNAMNSDVIE